MTAAHLPTRPRLADHAVVRRHRVGEEDLFLLHDQRSGEAYRLGPREWGLLAQADGTRDLDGIIAAAQRAGAFARRAALEGFLEALHAAGLLAEGPGEFVEPISRAPARPLDPLPGFTLACDGQGSCCRFYVSIVFRPVEEAYARALLPRVLDAGERPEGAFLPLFGSSPCGASAVGLVDGRCAYLERDGRCGLHAAQGPLAKPLGCRTYPTHFVDDGEAVRVAPAVECACVLSSALTKGEGEPLLPPGARSSHDLDEAIHVEVLSDKLLLAPGRPAVREDLVRFSRAVALAPAPPHVPRALVALAAAIESHGLDPDVATRTLAAPEDVEPRLLRPFFAEIAALVRRRERIDATYRSALDLSRRTMRRLLAAAERLAEDEPFLLQQWELKPSARASASEAFFLRAGAFAYKLFVDDAPIPDALRIRAARLLLARAFPLVASPDEPPPDPAFEHPLALVEAAVRVL